MCKLDLSFLRNHEGSLCQRKTRKGTLRGLSGRYLLRVRKSV
jgi:hypothetical protein